MDISCNEIKRAIIFYIVGLVLLFFVSLFFGEQVRLIINNIGLWILPALFSVFGLLIGMDFYRLLQRPSNKKNIIFLITHCVTLISMIVIAIVIRYNDLQPQKNYANIEANHDVMKYFVQDKEEYIRIGFNRLESEFKNPNDFN